MPELSDNELDALISKLPAPEAPHGMTERIMSAISPPPADPGLRGRLSLILGSGQIVAAARGDFASLLIGVTIGYLALPELPTEEAVTSEAYLDVVDDSNWDISFEDLLQ